MRRARRLLASLLLIGILLGQSAESPLSVLALGKPCSLDPNNLINNGAMRPGGTSAFGSLAEGWTAFVMSGTPPLFEWVDNEGVNPYGSQYIAADQQFDAGIYQTVQNMQPGVYYHLWVDFALAAVDKGGGINTRDDSVGRMIGVDPTGGSDPHSSQVIWGSEFTLGGPALSISALDGVFAAQADHVTVFVRALNHSDQYRHKVWFQTICMEARNDLPTATPLASPTPTASMTPTRAPTRAVVLAPTPTRVPTNPPTLVPIPPDTATVTSTTSPSPTPTETPKPRRPIPTVSAISGNGGGGAPVSMLILLGGAGFIGSGVFGALAVGIYLIGRPRHRAYYVPRMTQFGSRGARTQAPEEY